MLKSTLKFRTLIRTVIVLISIYFFQNHVNAQGYWEQSQLNGQLNMLGWGMVSYGGDSTLTYIEYKIIYVSKDNGISFKPKHQFEDSGNISSTQTVTDSMIICSWNYYLTVSYDAGSSWDTMKIKTQMGDTISYFPIHFYYFWRNGKAIIISRPDSYNQDSCYNIYLSDDYGNTWNKKDCSELNISEINSENKGGLGPRKYNVVDDKIFLQHPNSRNKMLRIYDYGNRIEEYTWDRDIYFEVFDLAFCLVLK